MKYLLAISLLITIGLTGCSTNVDDQKKAAIQSLLKHNLTLTDELVVNYINAYKQLKTEGPDMLEKLNRNGQNPEDAGKEGFNRFEATLKANGFKDYPEFVKTNAKVAWAFSLQQAGAFMNDMEGQKNEGLEQIDAQLKNPDVPEEAKEQLRKARAEITASFEKNTKWANVSMGLVKNLVNDQDVAVIKKHEKELLEAFTGTTMPEVPEGIEK